MRGSIAGLLALCLSAGCGQTFSIAVPGAPQPSAPRHYERLYSPAPWAFRFAEPPEPVRRGARSERFELREGDCGGSDCGAFRARAQIVQDREATPARLDRDIWFGWSFYNASIRAVTREEWLGTVVGEWKLAGEQPALFRFVQVAEADLRFAGCDPTVCTQAGTPGDDVVLELDEISQAQGWGEERNNGRICRLWSMEGNLGRWVDVVVNTNFGTDGTGYLRVWVNGELRCNYLGQMVSAERAQTIVAGPTNRRGLFESFTRRWAENFGAAPKPTLIAYYDEVLEGRSRAEVDTRLREAQGVRPVD